MKQNNCKCAVCGIEFYRKPSQIKNGVNTYCSVSEELRFDITNGITLCIVCHKKEHLRLSQSRTKQLDIFATQRGSIL